MLATALPSLPPHGASLLPSLIDERPSDSTNSSDGQNSLQSQQQQQQQQRRARGPAQNLLARNPLAVLANEERILEQRKQAIQTFGYSWLKPAGCNKTMLGRREEEIEREEVERQLREVELQERNAAEMEEAERMAQQEQQRVREGQGEIITGEDGDRDLDEEVPDMDANDDFDNEDEDDEDDESDLDDEIPEADNSYAYDTTRDPDTDSENSDSLPASRLPNVLPSQFSRQGIPLTATAEQRDRAQADLNTSQMLHEDDQGEYVDERDLDDDVPDMDDESRDLDDEVPDADEDQEGGWEHTDSELEESDMDISIMPPGVTTQQHSMLPPSSMSSRRERRPHNRASIGSDRSMQRTDLRRTSGNVPLPMAPPTTSQPANRRGLPQSRQPPPNFTPAQLDSDISVSALISTGNTAISSLGGSQPGTISGSSQRAWLDPASARRNLFGSNRLPHTQSFDSSEGGMAHSQSSRTLGAIPNLTRAHSGPSQLADGISRQVSSGGLFTPSPLQGGAATEEPRSRTRSGRAHGATRATSGRPG